MDAIVCVKQIPDPETPAAAFSVDEAAMQVVQAPGVSPVINPFDQQGVEAALRLREADGGDGTISVLSLGPDSARDAIKTGLAMGADEGYQLNDPPSRAATPGRRRSPWPRRSRRSACPTWSSSAARPPTSTRARWAASWRSCWACRP